jgi:hypothetical protein
MKRLSIFFLLFIASSCFGQRFGTVYTGAYYSKKQVERRMDKQIEVGKLNGSIVYSSKQLYGTSPSSDIDSADRNQDTLAYIVRSNTYSFTMKLSFHTLKQGRAYCDFQQIVFDCTCGEEALKETVKSHGFKAINKETYLSSWIWKTELTVSHNSESLQCLTFTYRTTTKTKDEFKAMREGIKK